MQCLTPFNITTEQGAVHTVPCGRCAACYSRRREEWKIRLFEESKEAKTSFFITLTYSDENIPYKDHIQILKKEDVQKFFRRFRKYVATSYKFSVRYYVCGEYGELSGRPHYHALLFFNDVVSRETLDYIIVKTWLKGIHHIGNTEEASIAYTLKYMFKQLDFTKYGLYKKLGLQLPFALMSKGIGKRYLKVMNDYHTIEKNFYTKEGGHKTRLPRYYRDRLYTKFQREKQNALERRKKDKEERKKSLKQLHIEAKHNVQRAEFEKESLNKKLLTKKVI